MSKFKNYFDSVDTNANMAAECGEIRSKAAKIRKRRKIATSSLGVTLAVMMTTTVAASAAGGWNITEIIGRWFSGNTEAIENNIGSVTAENAENKFEFLDISTNGSIIDDNMIIFFLDVTRNDGGIFDCSKYALTYKDGSIFNNSKGETFTRIPEYYFDFSEISFEPNASDYNGEKMHVRQYLVNDGDPTDNKITIAFCCDRSSVESQISENSKMTVGIGGLTDRRDYVLYPIEAADTCFIEGFSTERINGSWKGELMLDIKSAKTVTFEPNMASTFKVNIGELNEDGILEKFDYSFNVEKITLSQMSVSFEMSAEPPEQERYLENVRIGEIIMKNGDTLTIQPDSLVPCLYHSSGIAKEFFPPMYSTKWRVSGSVMLTEPIDPDDVKAVRLGDTTFPVK